MRNIQKNFMKLIYFDFMSFFFGLDFFKFSGLLLATKIINGKSSTTNYLELANSLLDNNPNQLSVKELQDKDVLDFQCHIDDFKENQMTKKVLIRLMNDWTHNDTKKTILLKEWIISIEEINRLKAENEKLRLEKSAEDDVANLIFQHDNNASEQENIKVEIKEDVEIHD